MSLFKDRADAGKQLAHFIKTKDNARYDLVLALPRGGVPIAYEISQELKIPLDVFIVRKLGTPGNEELAMGAIANGGLCIFNDELISGLNISPKDIEETIERESVELSRRNVEYRKDKAPISVEHKRIILVDDGVATGATVKAAILALKKLQPASLSLAIPVAVASSYMELRELVDEVFCLQIPKVFHGVAACYESFPQLSDEEVCHLLS